MVIQIFRYKSVVQGLYGMCKTMVSTPVLQKIKSNKKTVFSSLVFLYFYVFIGDLFVVFLVKKKRHMLMTNAIAHHSSIRFAQEDSPWDHSALVATGVLRISRVPFKGVLSSQKTRYFQDCHVIDLASEKDLFQQESVGTA